MKEIGGFINALLWRAMNSRWVVATAWLIIIACLILSDTRNFSFDLDSPMVTPADLVGR